MSILTRAVQLIPGARAVARRWSGWTVEDRVALGLHSRPQYAYGVFRAAKLARRLGLRAISVVEFGVATGGGLLALESLASEIGGHLDIEISAVGFDTGAGLPPPEDYRDLPHVYGHGYYRMDEPALRARLTPRTELILGNVADTVPQWIHGQHAPVGFVSFDLDFYSSTKAAFRIFDADSTTRLPRVSCYFDDTIWYEDAGFSEFTGERLAIREFNDEHADLKLGLIPGLRHIRRSDDWWNDAMYLMHDFAHPHYCVSVSAG